MAYIQNFGVTALGDISPQKRKRPKPEKVNLKFKNVRVQITNASNIVVREDDNKLVIELASVHN